MKKIISFSLWGNNPKYTIGAIKNANLANQIYTGWISRFYVDKTVPEEILFYLKNIKNTEVIELDEIGDWTGMFWRFYPASEEGVEVMISRDTDSRLSVREKLAVDEWLESDKKFHIMRDHPYHASHLILGGMWGVKNPFLKDMKGWIDFYKKDNFWQIDQNFLKEIVFPKIKNNCIVHDEFLEKVPFPSKRNGLEFVGQIFNENEETVLEHQEILRRYYG
jgi:protein O-GlcNAc transferase